MEQIALNIFYTLAFDKIRSYEIDADAYAIRHNGKYIADHGIKLTFRSGIRGIANNPMDAEFQSLAKRFKDLKKEHDVILTFILSSRVYVYELSNGTMNNTSYWVNCLLPTELQKLLDTVGKTIPMDDLVIKLRKEYRDKYFKFDIKRLLIKYQLFNL